MQWFGSRKDGQDPAFNKLAVEHREWEMLRDMAVLFKFLFSMLPGTKENMLMKEGVAEEEIKQRASYRSVSQSASVGRRARCSVGRRACWLEYQPITAHTLIAHPPHTLPLPFHHPNPPPTPFISLSPPHPPPSQACQGCRSGAQGWQVSDRRPVLADCVRHRHNEGCDIYVR